VVGPHRRGRSRRAVHERVAQIRGLRHAAGRRLAELDDPGPLQPGHDPRPKDRVTGGIYVSGSGTLVRSLLADGLVDELHLFVFPLAQGAGQRLFADSGPAIKLALAGSEAYSNGALHLTYQPAA